MTALPYDNNLRGMLFKNVEKATEKHPDYSGSCEINGQEYFMDGWLAMSKSHKPFLSIRFKPKTRRVPAPPPMPPPSKAAAGWDEPAPFDDNIPF